MDPLRSMHPCGQCAFYSHSVWRSVSGTSLKVLRRGFKRREVCVGDFIFGQGEDNNGVYCVSRGLIALRAHQMDGTSTLLRLSYPGDVIGFRSFLQTGPHQTEAVAVSPSRVCAVSQGDIKHLIKDNPDILARLTARCVDEIDRSHARIVAMATKSNKDRLSDLLRFLLERHGEYADGHMHMQLPLSRKYLADLIGVPSETLSRLLKRLQADGSFQIAGRSVSARVS